MLRERLDEVEDRIRRALNRSGRRRESVLLVAVTKTLPLEVIEEAYSLGLRDFGENYVQEFERKASAVSSLPGARFHCIGHLQSNKARRAAELFDVVETVDSLKLARRLSEAPARRADPLEILLEVKLGGEESKSGAGPGELPALMEAISGLPHLRLTGLMTIPPFAEDAEASRPFFQQLGQLAEGLGLRHLSMGMSGDFEVAIEEGATEIRVGTALFGPRNPV